ncbi:MAG: HRDC domain-containing protein [bacterium]|nr:HRDC domain-containing protein [bacterium]
MADQSRKSSGAGRSSERKTSEKGKSSRPASSSRSTKASSGSGKSGSSRAGVAQRDDFEIVDTVEGLEAVAKELMKEDVVAFDTEADSFYHYFDKVCLVQVATRKKCWLLDPLAIGGPDKLAPLASVFSSPKVRVLFHAAEYDIYVLKRDCGFDFTNLFDTMVSAQLLGYPAIGLAALIEKHFGVSLPKDEQRSDWSRRPLTEKQLSYAASDVLYLIKLAESLEKELKKAKRLDWAMDEFETLCGRRWPDREFDELGYLRIKGARSLEPTELAILRELFLLRDLRARDIDRPPFKVLGNRTLLEISRSQPTDLDSMGEIKGITDLILKRLGKDLVSAVKKGLRKPHGPIPKLETSGRRRMDRKTEKRLGALKDWRGPRAEALKLDPGVLCPNAALEAIAWAAPTNAKDLKGLPELKAWFVREFADEILGVIERHDADVAAAAEKEAEEKPDKPKRSRRGGRGRSGASRAKKRARRARKKTDGDEKAGETSGASKAKSED